MRHIRDAAWLTAARATAYCRILAVVGAVTMLVWGAAGVWRGGLDPLGRPLGPDFAAYYAAATLASEGRPAAAYDPPVQFAQERALFGGAELAGPTPFFYPPIFLLICLPFVALPYLPALLAWVGLTAAVAWAGVRAIWPRSGLALPVVVFPGFLINVANGQNGMLSTALFAAAALALERRPWLAGLCYGCLAYKPHLGLAVPFALLPIRAWSAILAGLATAAALVALSGAVLGVSAWQGFAAASALARAVLEEGLGRPERMTSVFAVAQLWNSSATVAYAAWAVVGVATCACLLALPRRCDMLARGAAVAAATPLLSPYLFDYDLAIIAVPLAWAMREAEVAGAFLPWEKAVLAAAFVLPLVSRPLATLVRLPVAPLVAAALLLVVLRRTRRRVGAAAMLIGS